MRWPGGIFKVALFFVRVEVGAVLQRGSPARLFLLSKLSESVRNVRCVSSPVLSDRKCEAKRSIPYLADAKADWPHRHYIFYPMDLCFFVHPRIPLQWISHLPHLRMTVVVHCGEELVLHRLLIFGINHHSKERSKKCFPAQNSSNLINLKTQRISSSKSSSIASLRRPKMGLTNESALFDSHTNTRPHRTSSSTISSNTLRKNLLLSMFYPTFLISGIGISVRRMNSRHTRLDSRIS